MKTCRDQGEHEYRPDSFCVKPMPWAEQGGHKSWETKDRQKPGMLGATSEFDRYKNPAQQMGRTLPYDP